MILKGTRFIKDNGVVLIVDDEIGDDILYHQEHSLSSKKCDKAIFHSFCKIEKADSVKELVKDLGFDYQRMSQSGQETYDKLCKLLKI